MCRAAGDRTGQGTQNQKSRKTRTICQGSGNHWRPQGPGVAQAAYRGKARCPGSLGDPAAHSRPPCPTFLPDFPSLTVQEPKSASLCCLLACLLCRGLNPGPHVCWAIVPPLSHKPTTRSRFLIPFFVNPKSQRPDKPMRRSSRAGAGWESGCYKFFKLPSLPNSQPNRGHRYYNQDHPSCNQIWRLRAGWA